jgi:hypothetical protein
VAHELFFLWCSLDFVSGSDQSDGNFATLGRYDAQFRAKQQHGKHGLQSRPFFIHGDNHHLQACSVGEAARLKVACIRLR